MYLHASGVCAGLARRGLLVCMGAAGDRLGEASPTQLPQFAVSYRFFIGGNGLFRPTLSCQGIVPVGPAG